MKNVTGYTFWPKLRIESEKKEEVFRQQLPIEITIQTLKDASFFFDFSAWQPNKFISENSKPGFETHTKIYLHRVAVLNAHYLFFYKRLGIGMEKIILTPSDIISKRSLDDSGMSFGSSPLSYSILPMPSPIPPRMIVYLETVKKSFEDLNGLLSSKPIAFLQITNLYLYSCKAYEDYDHSIALITAWAIIENLLQKLWDEFLAENRQRESDGNKFTFINKARYEKLQDGRNFSAAVISEILSLNNKIPFKTYEHISEIRKIRNNWIHELVSVEGPSAAKAIKTVDDMLDLVEGISFRLPLTSRLHF